MAWVPRAISIKEIHHLKLGKEVVYCSDAHDHPKYPWIVLGTYNEEERFAFLRFINPTDPTKVARHVLDCSPVRCCKFHPNKFLVVYGDVSGRIRVYDFENPGEERTIDAHSGSVDALSINPVQLRYEGLETFSVVSSSAEDNSIKVWTWIGGRWILEHEFEGCSLKQHNTRIPPNISNKAVELHKLSLKGKGKGLTCVAYAGQMHQYIVTGTTDGLTRRWDQKTREFDGSIDIQESVSTLCYHIDLRVLFIGSESGVMHWNARKRIFPGKIRTVSSIGLPFPNPKMLVIGGDFGARLATFTHRPVAVMGKRGEIYWCKGNKVQIIAPLAYKPFPKYLHTTELERDIACGFDPNGLNLSPKEGYISLCDGEQFTILYRDAKDTVLYSGLGNKVVWLSETVFAVKESTSMICFYECVLKGLLSSFWSRSPPHMVKEIHRISRHPVERIFGGPVFAICSNARIWFYDWTEFKIVHTIDLHVKNLYWAESGDLVAIVSHSSFSIYKFKPDMVSAYLEGDEHPVFELRYSVNKKVEGGLMVQNTFAFVDSTLRLFYCCETGEDLNLSPKEGYISVCDGEQFAILYRDAKDNVLHSGSANRVI